MKEKKQREGHLVVSHVGVEKMKTSRIPKPSTLRYMREKLYKEEAKKNRKKEIQNEFLFDNELHKEMEKYGINPYQE